MVLLDDDSSSLFFGVGVDGTFDTWEDSFVSSSSARSMSFMDFDKGVFMGDCSLFSRLISDPSDLRRDFSPELVRLMLSLTRLISREMLIEATL